MKCALIILVLFNITVWCEADAISDFVSQLGNAIKKFPEAVFGERPHSAGYQQHPGPDHRPGYHHPGYNQHRPDYHNHQHNEQCQHGPGEYEQGNNPFPNNHGQWNQQNPHGGGGYPHTNYPSPPHGPQDPGNGYGYYNYYNNPYPGNPYLNQGYNPYQDPNHNGFNNYPNPNNNEYNPHPNGNVPYNPGHQPSRRPDNNGNIGNQGKPNLYPNLDDLSEDNRYTPGTNQGDGNLNSPNKNPGHGGLIFVPGEGQQSKPFASQPGYPQEPVRIPNNNIPPVSPVEKPNVPVPTATEEEDFKLDIRFGDDNSTKPLEAKKNITEVAEVIAKSDEPTGLDNRKLFDAEGCPDGKELNNAGDCVKAF